MIIVTPEQMKYLEAEADRNGNTYEMLMEKAGERLAEKIISIINIEKNKDKNHIFDIIFLCGNRVIMQETVLWRQDILNSMGLIPL